MVTTSTGKVVAIESAAFDDNADREKRKGVVLVSAPATDIVDIATHPLAPEVCMLGASGLVQRWDVLNKRCLVERQLGLELKGGKVLAFARDASFLVAGCGSGHVVVLKSDTLEDATALRNTGQAITRYY